MEGKFDNIVVSTGIEDFINLPMRTYFSGMSPHLKFAVATSVLIVDEALDVGDKRLRDRSEGRIRSICEDSGRVFLVSHSMRTIEDTCNRALWIEKGVPRADSPAADANKEYQEFKKAETNCLSLNAEGRTVDLTGRPFTLLA